MVNRTIINTNDQAYQHCCVHCDECPCDGAGYSTMVNSGQTEEFVFITINGNRYGMVCQNTIEPSADHCPMRTNAAGQDFVYIQTSDKKINISGDTASSLGCHSIDPLPARTNNDYVFVAA